MRIKVSSPRTSLIPQRLFNFVAQIVQCHGKNREAILDLAKYNDGMDASDYAHPRYIAALLRIGDLLDIDDGRFCPTLLANIGGVPQSSHDHQHKHASIKHLFINSDVIEIEAECEEYGGYHAQQSWFGYIQDEFDFQKRVWNDIVPDNTYRSLPTTGKLNCSIKNLITLDSRVPKITLDAKRIYEYLAGFQLYSEDYPFIREIIQNSIDATYYRAWDELIDNEDVALLSDFECRSSFEEYVRKYPILVSLKEQYLDKGLIECELKVVDHGMGMALDDIKKILHVGSESVKERKLAQRNMPEWVKPAGYFGIGLHSIFNFCDKVIIKTKKIDGLCYQMTVEKQENINITLVKLDGVKHTGTELIAYFYAPATPKNYYDGVFANHGKYDPLCDEVPPYFSTVVRREIAENFSIYPMDFYFNDDKINNLSLMPKTFKKEFEDIWTKGSVKGCDFNLYISMKHSTPKFLFKGVKFRTNVSYPGISGLINIFSGSAGYWLTIDRKNGRSDRNSDLNGLIKEIIKNNSCEIRSNTIDKVGADFYLYSILNESDNNLWENYEVYETPIKDYLSGLRELTFSLGMAKEHARYLKATEVAFKCLGDIVRFNKVSFSVKSAPDESKRRYNFLYSIHFKNDGEGNVDIDVNALKYNSYARNNTNRIVIPCFNKCFADISLPYDKIPEHVINDSYFKNWVSDFIFLPKNHSEKEIDLEVIYGFYLKNSLTDMSKEIFIDKYTECWSHIID